MTNRDKMTDDEIIEVLKCCNTDFGCKTCLLSNGGTMCSPVKHKKFMDGVINLIKHKNTVIDRQKDEIELLNIELLAMRMAINANNETTESIGLKPGYDILNSKRC